MSLPLPTEDAERTREELLAEVVRLRARLAEPEETLAAIRQGEVDALIVEEPAGEQVYLLKEANRLFRLELQAVENLAGSILDQSLAALVVCDEAGLVLRANAAANRLASGDPLLRPFAEVFPLSWAEGGAPPLADALAGAAIQGSEARLAHGEEAFDLLVSAGPWRDARGALLGTIWNLADITAVKAAEADLRRAKREAEAASQAKDRFLATLSHEMRTPLTPVLAALSELIGRGAEELPPDLAATLRMIARNVELEARLIDDVLDLARISRGGMEIERRACDLGQVVQHAAAICRTPEVAVRGIVLTVEVEPGGLAAWGDPARLTQVVWNLIRNALKFTPDGGEVAVRCLREPGELGEAGGGGRLVVEVEDRGVGIAPELMPRLFDPFEQGGERGYERSGQSGLGLGLAISKTIVDLHGGELSASSAGPGRGATFRVELPGGLPEGAARRPAGPEGAAPGPRASARILLVEDHPDSAEALAHLLSALGHEVEVAGSVAQALAADWSAVDVLVSDIGLPDGSGLDLLIEARRRRPEPPIKAIALSGYGMESDRERSREAGFHIHLVKPTSLSALEGAIRQVLARG